MGLFSKLNFRAVDNAYHLFTRFNFYAEVMIKVCEVSETMEDEVDITKICEDVAHETAKTLGRMSSGELEFQTAVNRVAIAAQGALNDLTISSDYPQSGHILGLLNNRMPNLSEEILIAAKKGYLGGSLSDYSYLMEKNLERVSTSHARLKENQQRVWSEAFSKTLSSTPKNMETSIKDLTHGVLKCMSCNQSLNVPEGKHLRVSCPKCKASWMHDGRVKETRQDKPERSKSESAPSQAVQKQKVQPQVSEAERAANQVDEEAKINWLRNEAEFLQRKQAQGRELDDYELGLLRQYEELVSKAVD